MEKIDKLKSLLDQYPSSSISIEGHASSDGSEAYNQKLSERRADAVKAALIEKGISEEDFLLLDMEKTSQLNQMELLKVDP